MLKNFKSNCSSLTCIGALLTGIGTLLIGIAAFIALRQTSGVLEKIFEIKSAVSELKESNQIIRNGVDLIAQHLKIITSNRAVETSQILKSPNATIDDIRSEIKSIIPETTKPDHFSIYLPPSKLDETIELLYKEKDPNKRAYIIEKSLEYNSGIKN